ncbi:MAG: metallophosphoesterase [Pirellulales bacterium]|nr:metallophosphoesterase [Pirellulales bacterium]
MRKARAVRLRSQRGNQTAGYSRRLLQEPLEDRRLLAFTVNHTPYIQLGNAPLEGYNAGLDQAEILWQTTGTQDTDAFTAEYRATGTLPWNGAALNTQIVTGVGGRIVHSATFTGLSFDSDYDYQITHLRDGSPIAVYASTFHTRLNTNTDDNFTFVTYGDSASGDPPTNFIAVQNRINQIDPSFSLLLGDNVYSSGTHAEYDLRLDPSKNAALTTYNKNHVDYFGFGNHDVGYNSGQAARENYSMPIPVEGVTSPAGLTFDANVEAEENYSFDYGNVHFLTFDTNNWTNTTALNKQLDWAVDDITEAKARAVPPRWIIVFGHHPIVSLGGHTEHTPDDYYYDQVVSRLGASGVGVDLLLFGHSHNYQRSYPLTGHVGAAATYVLDGDNDYAKGAGLPLVVQGTGGVDLGYGANDATFAGSHLAKALDSNTTNPLQYGFGKIDVTPNQLTYRYINTLGQVLDTFTITGGPDVTPPSATVAVPLDNGASDYDPADGKVRVQASQSTFQIVLSDVGTGVDDATVSAAALTIRRDVTNLVSPTDYTFSYNAANNTITLTPTGGSFGTGNYQVKLNASGQIKDLNNNVMALTTLSVLIDPTVPSQVTFRQGENSYAGAKDTYVHEDDPATNQGSNAKIVSDGDDDLGTAETPPQRVMGLIRFDNTFDTPGGVSRGGGPIPDGANIANASLILKTGSAANDNSASTFTFHRMIATWTEASTWNSLTSGVSIDDVEAVSSPTNFIVGPNSLGATNVIDVTPDVQVWSDDNSLSTRGWVIYPALGTDGWRINSSNAATVADRPALEVIYALGPYDLQPGETYTIGEGAVLNLAGSAQGAGTLTYSWDINGDDVFTDATGATPTVAWAQLLALGVADGPGDYAIRLRVDDGLGHVSTSVAAILTIVNTPPTASAGGPYATNEGSGVALLASASDPAGAADTLTYSWDVNGDLVYGDATGVNPTLTWGQLVALGITDGNPGAVYNVRVRVDDGDGGMTTSAPTTLTIQNLSPTAAISAAVLAQFRGETVSYTLTAADPSAADQAGSFTWDIDWDNNGTWDQSVSGPSGTLVTHSYPTTGARTVAVRATDDDGGTGAAATLPGINVSKYVARFNGTNTDLLWGGTPGFDAVFFFGSGSSITILTQFENSVLAYATAVIPGITGRIKAYGHDSLDVISAEFIGIRVVELYGGNGDDALYGGNRGDWLYGGQGNDLLVGGTQGTDLGDRLFGEDGHDVLFGYKGADTLDGGSGEDLLIADNYNFGDDLYGYVGGTQGVWTDGSAYNDRIASLLFDTLLPTETIISDGAVDRLIGGADSDWFFYTFFQDLVSDHQVGEEETDADP